MKQLQLIAAHLVAVAFATSLALPLEAKGREKSLPVRADFKGAKLGMSFDEWRALDKSGAFGRAHTCSTPKNDVIRALGDVVCVSSEVTVAAAPARFLSFYFASDELVGVQVIFGSADFDQVATALQDRFGRPAKTNQEFVQNQLGASFRNEVRIWRIGGDQIDIEKYYGSLEDAKLSYISPTQAQRMQALGKGLLHKGAKDL